MENISIYKIWIKLRKQKETKKQETKEEKSELEFEELLNTTGFKEEFKFKEENVADHLFFGEKAEHLKPIKPFNWGDKCWVWVKKENDEQVLSYIKLPALSEFQFIELLIVKYPGKIENTSYKLKFSEDTNSVNDVLNYFDVLEHFNKNKSQPFQLIDIKWKEWNDEGTYPLIHNNNPKKTTDILLSWLLLGPEKEQFPFGDKHSYEILGLMKEDRLVNFSTIKKCFFSLSSKRILIIRDDEGVKEAVITVPGLEIAAWAAVGLMGASELIDELDMIEGKLWEQFEKLKKLEQNQVKKILKDTSNILRKLGFLFRSASFIQRFFSGYPISSVVAGLMMENFSRLTGSEKMILTLKEKLENAYRLYQLYQQYYYFKEMERLESEGT